MTISKVIQNQNRHYASSWAPPWLRRNPSRPIQAVWHTSYSFWLARMSWDAQVIICWTMQPWKDMASSLLLLLGASVSTHVQDFVCMKVFNSSECSVNPCMDHMVMHILFYEKQPHSPLGQNCLIHLSIHLLLWEQEWLMWLWKGKGTC